MPVCLLHQISMLTRLMHTPAAVQAGPVTAWHSQRWQIAMSPLPVPLRVTRTSDCGRVATLCRLELCAAGGCQLLAARAGCRWLNACWPTVKRGPVLVLVLRMHGISCTAAHIPLICRLTPSALTLGMRQQRRFCDKRWRELPAHQLLMLPLTTARRRQLVCKLMMLATCTQQLAE